MNFSIYKTLRSPFSKRTIIRDSEFPSSDLSIKFVWSCKNCISYSILHLTQSRFLGCSFQVFLYNKIKQIYVAFMYFLQCASPSSLAFVTTVRTTWRIKRTKSSGLARSHRCDEFMRILN